MARRLSRRQALAGLIGGSNFGLLPRAGAEPSDKIPKEAADAGPPGTCRLFPQAVEGPYYLDPHLVRPDITEGRPGLALEVRLKIIEDGSCRPLSGVRVDVWHADASGIYSGFSGQGDNRDTSTKGQTYLRGTQMTGADGDVRFHTVFPGWYPGRTPHIHIKAFLDDTAMLTGQMYFPDDVSARIYRDVAPYNARPKADTTNADDWIFKSGERDGGGIVFVMQQTTTPMIAGLVIAVDRSGRAASPKGGWRGLLRTLLGRE